MTQRGLEDQLLSRVIKVEKSELETERLHLVEEITTNKRMQKQLEDNLLLKLTSTQVFLHIYYYLFIGIYIYSLSGNTVVKSL